MLDVPVLETDITNDPAIWCIMSTYQDQTGLRNKAMGNLLQLRQISSLSLLLQ